MSLLNNKHAHRHIHTFYLQGSMTLKAIYYVKKVYIYIFTYTHICTYMIPLFPDILHFSKTNVPPDGKTWWNHPQEPPRGCQKSGVPRVAADGGVPRSPWQMNGWLNLKKLTHLYTKEHHLESKLQYFCVPVVNFFQWCGDFFMNILHHQDDVFQTLDFQWDFHCY